MGGPSGLGVKPDICQTFKTVFPEVVNSGDSASGFCGFLPVDATTVPKVQPLSTLPQGDQMQLLFGTWHFNFRSRLALSAFPAFSSGLRSNSDLFCTEFYGNMETASDDCRCLE